MVEVWNVNINATVPEVLKDLKMELIGTGLLKDINDVGTDVMCTCPFHKHGRERKPSMGVSKKEFIREGRKYEAGTIHCYTCGWTGDLPMFVAELLSMSSPIAGLHWMIKKYNYGSVGERAELELDLYRGTEKKYSSVDESIISNFIQEFWQSEKAYQYITNRKITEPILHTFEIGYDKDTNSIIFPVRDRRGNALFLKDRSILRKSFHNAKEIDKASVLYGLYQATITEQAETIWIVESEIDALTLWSWGEYAIALMGCDISATQVEELCKTRFRKCILALDNDEAGCKGTRKIKDKLIPLGFRLYTSMWDKSKKDINELTFQEFQQIKLI